MAQRLARRTEFAADGVVHDRDGVRVTALAMQCAPAKCRPFGSAMMRESDGPAGSAEIMSVLSQRWTPGIVGISTWVDFAYQREMQLSAVAAAGGTGPINQLRTVTVTLDFNLLVTNLRAGRKDAAEEQVAAACEALERAGADFIVVTSGTTSTLTARASERTSIPFLDLAEAAFREVATAPSAPVGLLSTSYAAQGGIFHFAASRRGAPLLLPPSDAAARLDEAIFGELVRGEVTDDFLGLMGASIADLGRRGAAAIVLGNTDMTLAAQRLQAAAPVPLIDSALAHARAAARAALAGRL